MPEFLIDPDTKIGPVHLKVSDLNQSLQFYTSFLGFKIVKKESKTVFLSPDGRLPYLVTLSETNVNYPDQRSVGLYHFAILLPRRKDLANFASYLLKHEKDVKIDGFSDHLVSEAIYIRDPDHIGIEIYCDREKSEWTWKDNKVRMTLDPLDMEGLIKASTRSWDGFPLNTTIGHVHLHVSSLEKAKKFYSEIMGFKNTASMQGALFFAAGNYHHHIATNVWLGENISKAPEGAPGLDYFTIEFSSKVKLDKVVKHLGSHGIDVKKLDNSFNVYDCDNISICLHNSSP